MRSRQTRRGGGFEDRGGDNVYRAGSGQGDMYLQHDQNQQRMADTIEKIAERLLRIEALLPELTKRTSVDTAARSLIVTILTRLDSVEDRLNDLENPITGADARLDALEGWRAGTVDPAVSALATLQSAVTTFKSVYNSHSHTYSYQWEGTGTPNNTSFGNPTSGPLPTA